MLKRYIGAATRIALLSQWIDDYGPNARRDREAQLWGRTAKIGEEFGEVIAAMIGITDQNPRKGITHNVLDVRKELFDVALTALCAVEHIDGNKGTSMGDFCDHIVAVAQRALAEKIMDEFGIDGEVTHDA